ncbi:MAG: acyltransferase, partial [Gaiellales bacterium]
DPWAVLAVGDLTFVGDEVFVNTSRPVVIGREVFLTQRSMIVTHNIGHSVLEGFENRFAPVVLEDMAQVGLATVVYAGCRIGARAIVGSNSYVVADVPEGAFAVGVPARVSGRAQVDLSRRRQVELAHRMVEDFAELLALRGHDVESVEDGPLRGLSVVVDDQPALVAFVERLDAGFRVPDGFGPVVVMTLELAAEPPAGVAVLDLLGHTLSGEGGVVLDAARELCRKRGIRFEPGPWRYGGGLI